MEAPHDGDNRQEDPTLRQRLAHANASARPERHETARSDIVRHKLHTGIKDIALTTSGTSGRAGRANRSRRESAQV